MLIKPAVLNLQLVGEGGDRMMSVLADCNDVRWIQLVVSHHSKTCLVVSELCLCRYIPA